MARGYKGFVLAAGFGTRLKPITNLYPKPLVPFLGSTPLAMAIKQLRDFGLTEIAVNTHYLGDIIASYLRSNAVGNGIHISHEPSILGTGGAYVPLRKWLGDDDLVILNGDVIANFVLADLVSAYHHSAARAAMMLLPEVIPGQTPIYHNGDRVNGIGQGEGKAANFACAQILSAEVIASLPNGGEFDIISKGYRPLLAAGDKVACAEHHGYWHDLGTPVTYWQAIKQILGERSYWAGEEAVLGNNLTYRGSVVIENGAQVADNSVLENCLILPGSRASGTVKDVILGPDFTIAL